tara:strand:- start:8042 stop:8755 length:714 start_codon:yes stop_codon:yes gene_type:complete
MNTSIDCHNTDNVVDFFTGKPFTSIAGERFIRLAPELDGLEMVYTNDSSDGNYFSLKILCWGLRANGEVVGLVPWLDSIVAAPEITDPLHGQWEGYFDPGINELFTEPPIHKVIEVETAAEYYEMACEGEDDVIQEIPDMIGTHAVLSDNGFHSITLSEVISWQLLHDGTLWGMLADEAKVKSTPVLPGDKCLYPAQSRGSFRYFFQHNIANKLKDEDPEALAAISLLVEEETVEDA